MKIAIFIEEDSSKKLMRTFIHRILGKNVGIVERVKKQQDLLKEEKVEAYIKNDILLEHLDISKIIICVDCECTPEEERLEQTIKIEKNLKSKIGQPLSYINIVHAIEGWLLSDSECIQEYLGSRVKVNIPPSASKECKPKDVMKDIFRKAGRSYLHTVHNAKIAELANPERMIKSNKSFKKFYDVIKDP
jgi:hypothetical protein